jgi:hypothetical protein
MVNRPDSSSTRSDKSSSSRSSSMNRGNTNKSSFVRSKSGNDYNDKSAAKNRLRNSSSLQSIAKSGGKSGMRKFKSNGRFVYQNVTLATFDRSQTAHRIRLMFYHSEVFVNATIDLFTFSVYLCTTVGLRTVIVLINSNRQSRYNSFQCGLKVKRTERIFHEIKQKTARN